MLRADDVAQFNDVAEEIDLESQAKKLDRSPYEVRDRGQHHRAEVRADEDRAKVARVLYNRLDKGEPLGLDSTVIYAENLKTNTTTPKDRASTSKYNTYKYTRACRPVRSPRPARRPWRPRPTPRTGTGCTS